MSDYSAYDLAAEPSVLGSPLVVVMSLWAGMALLAAVLMALAGWSL
ncbi:hypothetical protein [Methanomassiliicoccus luminyensis]|nr:hypothetical protein [Methanomassiliicoccus luminyensis]